jgi:YVTN family beta-propeller protein
VTPIATATNTPGQAIKTAVYPNRIAVTPDGKTAYVTNLDSGTVTPIQTATNTAGKPIKISGIGGGFPLAIAVTPDGKTVYVTNPAPHSGSTVTPIRTATNTPGKPIKVGGYPVAIAFAPRIMETWLGGGRLGGASGGGWPGPGRGHRPGRPG